MRDQGGFKNNRVLIQPLKPKTFKAYPLIVTVMAVFQLLGIFYARYWVDCFHLHLPLGTLICTPIVLYIFQIVAECYGWQYGRQIMWCDCAVNGLFAFITFFVRKIPIASGTDFAVKNAYNHLIGTVWVTSLMALIAIFIADYLATVFMARSKLYFKGGLLGIRLLVVQIVTETILVSTGFIIMPYNGYSMVEACQSMWQLFIARNIIGLLLAPCAIFTIWFIQNYIEQVVSFDSKKSWNIFKWSIQHQDTIQFNSRQWSCLSIKDKLQLDIPVLTIEYYAIDKMSEGYYEYVTRSSTISKGSSISLLRLCMKL